MAEETDDDPHHDPTTCDEADQLAARLAIVDRGRIVVEGTATELKSALEGDRIEIDLAEGDAPARSSRSNA